MDKIFEDHWNKIDIQNIMNKVAGRYKTAIDFDDIESIKMQTLWKCIQKYDKTRGSKFTSYLYQQYEIIDILTGLDPELKEVINQRFYHNMTMVEIGHANGYSRETARRRLKKAIKTCKKNCIS